MIAASLTAVVLTHNEEANIARTLEKLAWVGRVVVIDSFSTDGTLEILKKFPNVRVEQRRFDDFASQCNHALSFVETPWVLSLDADYVLTDELVAEIQALAGDPAVAAYETAFRYCIFGRPLRSTLLPPRPVLFRREGARYERDGHAQRLKISGRAVRLAGTIHHDDRKPLARWIAAQERYSVDEARKLLDAAPGELGLPDRLRRLKFVAPFAVLVYCLFVRGLVLDGWRGVFYSFQRMVAELWLSVHLIEEEARRRHAGA